MKGYELDKKTFTAFAEPVEKGEGTNADHPAAAAIDGSPATYWECSEGPRWLGIDLGANYCVAKVQVQSIADGIRFYRYEIQASMDGIDWITAAFKRDNRVEPEEGFTFDTEVKARYLRIYVMHNSASTLAQVGEVSVWGYLDEAPKAPSGKKSGDILLAESSDDPSRFEFIEYEDFDGRLATDPSKVKAGDYLAYRNVDFGAGGADQFRIRACVLSTDKSVSQIEIRMGSVDGTLIGSMPIFRQWRRRIYETFATDISLNGRPVTGVHDVYIVVKEVGTDGFGIHWVQFAKRDHSVPRPAPAPLSDPEGEYNVFFGNFHSHTSFSDGAGVPDMAYLFARNEAGLDFLAITDHSNLMDFQFEPSKSRKWAELRRLADENTKDGEFAAFAGYEMTWYGNQGHMNVYDTELFETAGNMVFDNVQSLYDFLSQDPSVIAQWNHPWDASDSLVKFSPYHEGFDKVLKLVEARALEVPTKSPMHYYKDYILALDLGWHVAPAGSEDNHKANWGRAKQEGRYVRTAFLAEKLTREHLYDAIRNYRVYTTTDANMKVVYTVNGQIMGSTLANPSQLTFDIRVTDPDPDDIISKIEILTEGGAVVYTHEADASAVHITPVLPADNKYYFLRVTQADGEMAITAPVWVE